MCSIPRFLTTYHTHTHTHTHCQLLFDYAYFLVEPEPFFAFARDIFPGARDGDSDDGGCGPLPALPHYFLAALEKSGRLLRVYTQNVDALELEAGKPLPFPHVPWSGTHVPPAP